MTIAKLRRARRREVRITLNREALGWWEVFAHKNDYFGGLAKLFEIDPDYRCSEREAWDRCGAIFLKHWRPGKLDGDPLCYAWRKYGAPPGWEGAPPAPASLQEQCELSDDLWRACGMKNARMLGKS